ncbi:MULTISPECIES: MFS transporter [Comamonadaceae]|jgi:MFS family permease|uniref:MFS transporter n=1 Tax=Acidovorax facilis TaxID=12917 RepID=A0ABV8DIC8_9BURK|nr:MULTISPECIES: MFS transporter [Comamonadaceae]MBU0789229.1 MFS transporter [Gammaproteobacteria bacterium]EHL22383.1 major facilitator transporter [Acidovorax sp. NO-1]KQB60338.1 hypothetical protein AE621_05605 [Acidovorax sp. SD340]MBO1009633.1 MFS transporter [Acidovorax sp. SD340]MCO4243003.1 MFS transporter [Acidovorax facilis]
MTVRRPAAASARQFSDIHFVLLLVAGLAVSMSYGVTLPVLPELVPRVRGGGADVAARHTGWLTGAYTVALFACSPVWGAVSDFLDRRWVIAIGLAGSAIALSLLGTVSSLAGVYAARIGAGLVAAAVMPAVLAYVAETTAPERRQRRFAWVASATALGFLLGPVAGSAASALGNRVSGLDLVASVCLLAAVLAARLPRVQGAEDAAGLGPAIANSSVSLGRMRRALLLTAAVVFGITVAEVGLTLQGGPVGPYFALCSVLMVAMQLVGYPVLERWIGEHRLVWISLAVMAVGVGLLSWRAPWSPAVAFVLAASALGVLIPALAVRISSAAGLRQGRAMGRQAAAGNLGQAGGAALTGVLFSAVAPAPFLLAGAMLAVGAVIAWAKPEGVDGSSSAG